MLSYISFCLKAPGLSSSRLAVLVGVLTFSMLLFAGSWLNDPDTYWHIATGQWILQHHAVPYRDPFSWTMAGQRWVAHEWLCELLMAVCFAIGGWTGLVLLASAAVSLAAYLFVRAIERGAPPMGVVLALLCAMMSASPGMLARPHMLVLPALVAWSAGLIAARRGNRVPSLWLLPVMTIWANMHGGYMIGVFLAFALAAEAVLYAPDNKQQTALRWGGFCLGTVLAAALNPRGFAGLLFPFQLLHMQSLQMIVEWRPIDPWSLEPVDVLIPAALYITLIRKLKLPLYRWLMLIALCWIAIKHTRNQMLLGMIGPLLMAGATHHSDRAPIRVNFPALVLALVAVLSLTIRLVWPVQAVDNKNIPSKAIKSLDSALTAKPVFNDFSFGGPLIFHHIRPFIDGRVDMYGDAAMNQYQALSKGGQALHDYLANGPIAWVITPADSAVAKSMTKMTRWQRIYCDTNAVVYKKP